MIGACVSRGGVGICELCYVSLVYGCRLLSDGEEGFGRLKKLGGGVVGCY